MDQILGDISGNSSSPGIEHNKTTPFEVPEYVIENEDVLLVENITTYSIDVTELR